MISGSVQLGGIQRKFLGKYNQINVGIQTGHLDQLFYEVMVECSCLTRTGYYVDSLLLVSFYLLLSFWVANQVSHQRGSFIRIQITCHEIHLMVDLDSSTISLDFTKPTPYHSVLCIWSVQALFLFQGILSTVHHG